MEKPILEAILAEIKSQNIMSYEIWNADDIAKFLRLSKSSVQSRIICRTDFPRPIRIPTADGAGGRRWYSKEVKVWISGNREPLRTQ